MRAFIFLCIFSWITGTAGQAKQLALPEFHRRVIDQSGTLSESDVRSLEATLEQFERETSNQVVVLMIPTLQGESIEDYALRVAEKNKFGKKERNNGILLIIAKEDRKLRIEVGYGLEGALPDATADQIIRHEIAPRFRSGDYYGGVKAGIDAIMAATKGEYQGEKERDRRGLPIGPIIFLLFGFIILSNIILSRARRGYLSGRGYYWGGPWWWGGGGGGGFSGGSFGGGGFSGGGFSGGGGSFGGGGASGSW